MATLDRADYYRIRAWVGSEPTEADLQARHDDLGGELLEVARQILQERLGDLTSGPASWGAEGDYREDNTAIIKTLRQQIADLSLLIDGQTIPGFDPADLDAASPSQLTRDDRERIYL